MSRHLQIAILAAAAVGGCAAGTSHSGGRVSRPEAAPDPTPPQAVPCSNAYNSVLPTPRGIMGATELGAGCAIVIAFETARDLDEFVTWREQHGLAPRMVTYADRTRRELHIPLQLEVGGPALPEPAIGAQNAVQHGIAPDDRWPSAPARR